jgi:hypothetical protein
MIKFFGSARRVINVLHDHIMKNNAFVQRWKGRMQRAATKARNPPAASPASDKKKVAGRYGDVEWTCYEAWVSAYTRPAHLGGQDTDAMMDAIKRAMTDEITRERERENGL